MNNKKRLFLVLVPHRDTRLILRRYSDSLFKAGYEGAYSFPWVTPLATLSLPLNRDELKYSAHALRNSNTEGKFHTGQAAIHPLCGKKALFGPSLNLSPDIFNSDAANKTKKIFSVPVIGACLLPVKEDINKLLSVPRLSFRAAAIANMFWDFLDEDGAESCNWQIGKPVWLPNTSK
jgi:ribosomal protein L28